MTYVSKKEKVFDLPEQESESSTISLQNTETRLKRFPSVSDRRAWTSEECQRYQHLYGLVNGSESSVSKSSGFKYIPFDVLLGILMAEKDAYIQELLDRQDDKSGSEGKLYKAEGFEDSDDDRDALIRKDAEMVALKNKIAGLESELEDYRDTLTKAMHKLENMDDIMKENNFLREKKVELEKELEECNKRSSESESEMDENDPRWIRRRGGNLKEEEIFLLSSERNLLQEQVEELQKELEKEKVKAAELQVLRKMFETTSRTLEEVCRENECYKKKLETMKYLEKHIEELKKEAYTLTDKYKRECQKANDHLKQANLSAKEVQTLREDRDRLQKRVEELVLIENQYISLQSKLHQVEVILDENELLNKKLIQLDRLELENEHLKMKIDQMQDSEMQAAKDKEKIRQLQCEVVDQEEEMRKMLRQIEDLTEGYIDRDEIHRLRNDLEDKNGKLMQYERQLMEIPILESEIEELRNKLQKYIDNFKIDKDLLKRLQEELETCRSRCHELEEMASLVQETKSTESILNFYPSDYLCEGNVETQVTYHNKGENTDMLTNNDVESQSAVISCEEKCTEAMPDEFKQQSLEDLRELEEKNKTLKLEVEQLRSKLAEIDLDHLLQQTNDMKEVLHLKEKKISHLEANLTALAEEIKSHGNVDELRQNRDDLHREVSNLKEVNDRLVEELKGREDTERELNKSLRVERKARIFALNLVKDAEDKLVEEIRRREKEQTVTKLQKEEANMIRQELFSTFMAEVEFWKSYKHLWDGVIRELKSENQILRELKEYSDKVEGKAMKGLIKKLRAKVKALKSLSKPELQAEYECVQHKVRLLLKETDTLVGEINDLKSALDSEKRAKEFLERELIELQAEITTCMTAGTEAHNRELAAKESAAEELRKELADVHHRLENADNELRSLKQENTVLVKNCSDLKCEEVTLRREISQLLEQIEEQKHLENEINRLSEQMEKQKSTEEEYKRLCAEMKERKLSAESKFNVTSTRLDEQKHIECELRRLSVQMEEQKKVIIEQEDKEKEYLNEIIALKTQQGEHKSDLHKFQEREKELLEKCGHLEKELEQKDLEMKESNESCANSKAEINKRRTDVKILKSRLVKMMMMADDEEGTLGSGTKGYPEADAAEDAEHGLEEESHDLDEAMTKIENKINEFKVKLNECETMNEEMRFLRDSRDSLQVQVSDFEVEIALLKKKLHDFEYLTSAESKKLKDEEVQLDEAREYMVEVEDVTKLSMELEGSLREIEKLKLENENLRTELSKAEDVLELSKKLNEKNVSQVQAMPSSSGFYTPPAASTPRDNSDAFNPTEQEEEMITIDDHRRQLTDLENHFERELQKLKEANAKKVKKLTWFHERDAKCRSKAFHDSINVMKSNYENGIKKLVEKHKMSITKLQELHEEEVEELNTKYEREMIAMEKQNEDLVGDMKRESSEKCKALAEQHNRELKAMETRYEKQLIEKDKQIEAERTNAESKMTQNTSDLQLLHKQAVDNLTQFYQGSIFEMEEKHAKEMKKCKKNNSRIVEQMRNKYEDLLVEERKKYEEQLENMLHQLKDNGPRALSLDSTTIQELDRRNLMMEGVSKNPSKREAASSLKFVEVLQKIINEGLQSLTFEELILIHGKTCFLLETIRDHNEKAEGEVRGGLGDGCRHTAFIAEEKEALLKRIMTLENEIVIKQLETHEAIVNMEAAEKYCIQELEKALMNEQQKNTELQTQLSNQSKIQTDMKIEKYMLDRQASLNETNVMEKVKELEREKGKTKRLEEELQRERANLKNLMLLMESEKERFKSQRKRDSDYVESMRNRLEEALNYEQLMESQLDYETKFRTKLELELQSLQKNFNFMTDSVPSSVDPKAVKELRNSDQCDSKKADDTRKRSRSKHKSCSKAHYNH